MGPRNFVTIFTLFVLFASHSSLFAQPDSLWSRTYGGSSDDAFMSSMQTMDSNFTFIGYTASYGAGSHDIWFVKTDENGDSVWSATYGEVGYEVGIDLVQTDDGGYVILGEKEYIGSDHSCFIMRTNSSGDTLWTRQLGIRPWDSSPWDIEKTEDDELIIAGDVFFEYPSDWGIFMLKIDMNGDTAWYQEYSGTENRRYASVLQAKDGGYLITGTKLGISPDPEEFWVLKLNQSGTPEWSNTYDAGIGRDFCCDAVQTRDGGYVLVGRIHSVIGGIWLVKANSSGDSLWSRTYRITNHTNYPNTILQTQDGGMLLTGSTYGSEYDIFLIRTDANGDSTWSRIYGDADDQIVKNAYLTSDGGYMIAGYTSPHSPYQYDAYSIRMEPDHYLCGALDGTIGPGVYEVICDIRIDDGDTLEILPGTTLNFHGDYEFEISGHLRAIGTESDSIYFTCDTVAYPNRYYMIFVSSNDTLEYCTIENASTAMNFFGDGTPLFSHCLFRNNRGTDGGAFYSENTDPVFECCVFKNNSSSYGGAAYIYEFSVATFTNCIFLNNHATMGGGAINVETGGVRIINCTFSENSTESYAGAILLGSPWLGATIINSIITESIGSGILFAGASDAEVMDCCFYNNSGDDFEFNMGDPAQGPYQIGTIAGSNWNNASIDYYSNFFEDPLFVDPESGDLHLSWPSLCIGIANKDYSPSFDFDGINRNSPPDDLPEGRADIGAYEFVHPGLCGSLSGTIGPGSLDVYCDITVETDSTLTIEPGTTLHFHSINGSVDLEVNGVLRAMGSETDSITFTCDTIANPYHWNGLKFIDANTCSLSYCKFENIKNSSSYGSVTIYQSPVSFSNCLFNNNTNMVQGGALTCLNSNASILQCCFISNYSGMSGGALAIECAGTDFSVENCLFIDNYTDYHGGAILITEGGLIGNCSLVGNSAFNLGSNGGGVIAVETSVGTKIVNTLITESTGSGLFFRGSPECTVRNCDIFGNSEGEVSFYLDDPANGPSGIGELAILNVNDDSCDIYENLFLDPNLTDPGNGNYTLQWPSPCIEAADEIEAPAEDFAGVARGVPVGTLPDIGAFEFEYPPLCGTVSDTFGPGVLNVYCDLTVNAGDTLTILPGTTLDFQGSYRLDVYGTLLAEGVETDSIIFTIDTLVYSNRWHGIDFIDLSSNNSRLAYCKIENAAYASDNGDHSGGGIGCIDASPAFSHCMIVDNIAEGGSGGAGVCCYGNSSEPEFTSCVIARNRAHGDYVHGGGLYNLAATPRFTDCRISSNHAPSSTGGGVALNSSNGTIKFVNCRISENSAQLGGGILCNTSAEFISTTISNNSAELAGAVFASYAGPLFESCRIDSNSSESLFGNVFCMDIEQGTAEFINCMFVENAGYAGALVISRSNADINFCTFYGNEGDAVYCDGQGVDIRFRNSIVAESERYGVYLHEAENDMFEFLDIFGNLAPFGFGSLPFDSSAVPPGIGVLSTVNNNHDSCDTYYNTFFNPGFVDASASDLRLTDVSYCIGAGNALEAPADDHEGNPRPDPTGSQPDIGAYENALGIRPGLICGNVSGALGPDTLRVVCDIQIGVDDTLELLPGTVVWFSGDYRIDILGTLLALGTESDGIVFTTDTLNNPNRWGGLRFSDATSSNSRLEYCTIEHGLADGAMPYNRGGGIYIENGASPEFEHCVVHACSSASYGGGIAVYSSGPVFSQCQIRFNSSTENGGGIFQNQSTAQYIDCRITDNMSYDNGGGCHNSSSSSYYENCLITNNWADNYGGGVFCSGDTEFEFCTIEGNECASLVGGGICFSFADISVKNTIISNSIGSGLHFLYSDGSTVEYCNLYGSSEDDISFAFGNSSNGPSGIGNLTTVNANGDDCDQYFNIFIDPEYRDVSDSNYQLMASSHCIGAAESAGTPTGDINDHPRPNPPLSNADIGAFESLFEVPMQTVCGSLSGTLGPDTLIVSCNVNVLSGDTLRLLSGTTVYVEDNFDILVQGVLLVEGTESDPVLMTTDLGDNPSGWKGVYFVGSSSSGSVLQHCIIENVIDDGAARQLPGGGITCEAGADPLIEDCIIRDCYAARGGGIRLATSSPTFLRCTIENNESETTGGGLFCHTSSPVFMDCIFIGNHSGTSGGGTFNILSTGSFTNCLFVDNTAGGNGGGAYCNQDTSAFNHCTFFNNSSTPIGSGLALNVSEVLLHNSVVVFSNRTGVHFTDSPLSTVQYCDVYGNAGGEFGVTGTAPAGIGTLTTTNSNADACDVYFNIQMDPLFADTTTADYHLQAASPCVGAANDVDTPPFDLDGNDRPQPAGSLPDMGVYESSAGPLAVVTELTITSSGNDIILRWDYPLAYLFTVYSDSIPDGEFTTVETTTTDFTVTLTDEALNSEIKFYRVTAEVPPAMISKSVIESKVNRSKTRTMK